MRGRKEKEKQTEQDREISKTQLCAGDVKAEMEVKGGVSGGHPAPPQPQRVSSAVPCSGSLGFPGTSPVEPTLSRLLLRDMAVPLKQPQPALLHRQSSAK